MGSLQNTQQRIQILPLESQLAAASSLREGLDILKSYLVPHGVCDLFYVYMLHKKSHVRNDCVLLSTFPKDIAEMFWQNGGSASYNYGDVLPTLTAPLYFDIASVLDRNSPIFSFNACTQTIFDVGYRSAWFIPFVMKNLGGFGLMMMFQDYRPNAPKISIDNVQDYGLLYHKIMRDNRQLARYFDLTPKQCQALANIAKGHTSADLATKLGLSERAIEERLHAARAKLGARTTAEAVYKALAYLILPCPDEQDVLP